MIEEFPEINFPHIKYLAATGELAQIKKGVYIGGDQNSGLIVDNGIIYAPYISVNNSTSINGETVWYRNKFKNFLLKVKFFFFKPKFFKSKIINPKYSSKIVNPKYYSQINITHKSI